jgi:O-antigen ligase
MGGGNSALLGASGAMASLAAAALIFWRCGTDRALWPAAALGAALLAWGALTPHHAAPDLLPQALAKLTGTLALLLASMALSLRPGHTSACAKALVQGAAALILGTVLLRMVPLPAEWSITPTDTALHRFSGTLGNPNAEGILFAMLGTVASGLALERFWLWYDLPGEKRLIALLSSALVALGCLTIVGLSQSRSALLLWMLAQLLLLGHSLWPSARARLGAWRMALALAASALLLPLAASATLDRLGILASDSAGRVLIWQTYLPIAWQSPWTGHGLSSFIAINQAHLRPDNAVALWNFGAAHAAPLQILIETGWPGLALSLALLGVLATPLIRRAYDPLSLAITLALAIALGASMVDIALNVPGIAALFAVLAGLNWGRARRSASA